MSKSNDGTGVGFASRRKFLTGAASLAVGAVGVSNAARTADQTSRSGNAARETDYDVIVVGGGFAGVTAARDCALYGLKTLMLEARNRIGGRTFDTHWNDEHIEMGGTWVHWVQPYTWAEIQRYGLTIKQTPGAVPDRLIAVADGLHADIPYSRVSAEISAAADRYFFDARDAWERPWDTHFNWNQLVAKDKITTLDRLNATKMSKVARTVLEATMEVCTHSRIDRGSYLEIARWYALGGWSFGLYSDAIERYQIAEGTGELAKRMLAQGNPDVHLSSPVNRIEQHDGAVIVKTPNATYGAKAIILALPMNCLANIEFAPALAEGKIEASKERHSAVGMKFYAEVKGRHGNVMMVAPYKFGAGYCFTYHEKRDSTIFVCFGSNPDAFDPNDEESVQKVMRQFIPDAEVLACTSYSWLADPFSLGTYCSFKPGKVTRWFDVLRRQEGRIYIAGSDVAEGWRGFIDGAIATGARAATQVATDLKS